MLIKFGFYQEFLDGLGLYDPSKDFRTATIHYWIDPTSGQLSAGNPVGKNVSAKNDLVLIETKKATEEWNLAGLLPGSGGGVIRSINSFPEGLWRYRTTEQTPYGTLLLPELGTIEVSDEEAMALQISRQPQEETASARSAEPDRGEPSTEAPSAVATPPRAPLPAPHTRGDGNPRRISIPALGESARSGLTPDQLAAAYPDRRWVSKQDVADFKRAGIVEATPGARFFAAQNGLELREIPPSGMRGEVTRADVERILGGAILRPISTEWRTIAHNLEEGISGSVVAFGAKRYDLRKLLAFRDKVRAHAHGEERFREEFGARFRTWLPIPYAVTRVLAKDIHAVLQEPSMFRGHALANGYWYISDAEKVKPPHERENERIAFYTAVHLGLSYDPGIVPKIDARGAIRGQRLRILTLRDAHQDDAPQLFRRIDSMLARADSDAAIGDGRIRDVAQSELHGATFIFNNIGVRGHEFGHSLIPAKMSAMLNMGIIDQNGTCLFQLFFDHRIIDGGGAATSFLDAVIEEELMGHVLPEFDRRCFPRRTRIKK